MTKFTFHNPVQYVYGANSFHSIGELSSECGTKALIVTYDQEYFIKLSTQTKELLLKSGVASALFAKVEVNPTTFSVIEGARMAKKQGCDFIIGIGGGSALDTAKGIAHSMKNGEDITNYMYGKKQASEAAPFVLVPTTAGTGSEGNNFAIFTNPENSDKKGIASQALYARYSILDPVLLATLPPRIAAGPGLDALFHCIEAYTSRSCSPVVEAYALHAIKIIGENLEKMVRCPSDTQVCQQMQIAALLGGVCIGVSGVGIPHAIDHPIGGLYNIVHADGLAALYPASMEFIKNTVPDKFARIAEALGKDMAGKTLEQGAEMGKEAVIELIKKVGMETDLNKLNVQKKDIDWIINNTQTVMAIALTNSAAVPNTEELRSIILKSFER